MNKDFFIFNKMSEIQLIQLIQLIKLNNNDFLNLFETNPNIIKDTDTEINVKKEKNQNIQLTIGKDTYEIINSNNCPYYDGIRDKYFEFIIIKDYNTKEIVNKEYDIFNTILKKLPKYSNGGKNMKLNNKLNVLNSQTNSMGALNKSIYDTIINNKSKQQYIHIFPEEHKIFLPVIENILCDLYGIDYDNDKERIYTEKGIHRNGELKFTFDSNRRNIVESTIPPKGSIVFFCHFVAMRIDNWQIENILQFFKTNGINVINILLYRSKGSYKNSLIQYKLEGFPAVPFMERRMTLSKKPVLSHKWTKSNRSDIPLNKDTIQALKEGYTDSLNMLQNHLEEVDPTLKNIFKNKRKVIQIP